MTRALWSHHATAQGACASSTSPVYSSGSRALTLAAVSSVNISSSWRPSSNHCARWHTVCALYVFVWSGARGWLMLTFISGQIAALPPSVPTELTSLLRHEAENAKSCLQSVSQLTQSWHWAETFFISVQFKWCRGCTLPLKALINHCGLEIAGHS